MEEIQSELKSFNKRLEKLSESLKQMKELGVDETLLISWLCHNLKISEKKAVEIINCYEEFYNKLLKKYMLKELKS